VLYRIGADSVLLGHFVFVAFAVFGGVLVYWSPVWPWLHVPVVVWSAVVNLFSWTCPLTPLEKVLRVRAGQSGYAGGFVEHYVGRLVYPRGMPRQMELTAGVAVIAWNVLVYAVVLSWMAM
jgi:hypothetical protein